jgi:hypothetical protein
MQLLVDVSNLDSIRQGINVLAYLEAGAVQAANAQVDVQQVSAPPSPEPLPPNVTPMSPAPLPDSQSSQDAVLDLRQRIKTACDSLGDRMDQVEVFVHAFGVAKMSELSASQLAEVATYVESLANG